MLKKKIIAYILIIITATVFMLFFAYNNSPLIQNYGPDGGMYLVMGKTMSQGGVLYSELFDHKGPMIFIVNMLGQLFISGSTGVWLLELAALIIAALLLYKMACLHIEGVLSFAVPLVYIWVSVTLFRGGNYTEEFSNVFCVISLYIFSKWQENKTISAANLIGLGVCSALVFLFRPNNVALIFSIIIYMFVSLFRHSKEKLRSFFGYGILGILTVLIPICIYHLCTGTLYEMLYATVLHNLNYCKVGNENFNIIPVGTNHQQLCVFIVVILIIIAVSSCMSSNQINSVIFILMSTIITAIAILIGGYSFIYYWTLFAPIAAYSVLCSLKNMKKPKARKKEKYIVKVIALVLIAGLMCINCYIGNEISGRKEYADNYRQNAAQMYEHVPENERESCFAFNMPAYFIYEMDLETPLRYFAMQTWMSRTNPDIEESCKSFISEKKPKWIFVNKSFGNEDESIEIREYVEKHYTQEFSNDCGSLLKRLDVN